MNLLLIGNGSVVITAKEVEVVKLLCKGLKTAQVATKLEMSPRTLEADIGKIKRKTGSNTIGQLVYNFMKSGLVE